MFGIWGYVGAALLSALLVGSGTYYVTSRSFEVTIADMKTEQAQKSAADVTSSLKQLQGFIDTMHVAATDYGNQQNQLYSKLSDIDKEFANATHATPLPPDCKPDDVRLRLLSAAVAAANLATAAGPGISGPLPATP